MYKSAFRTFFRNYPIFLLVALLMAGADAFGIGNLGVTFVICGILALYSHRMVLLDEQYGWTGGPAPDQRKLLWPFLWRYGVLTLLYVGAVLYIAVEQIAGSDETRQLAGVLAAMLMVAPVMAVVLTLFGTVLPASAIGGDRSIGRALMRGRKRFVVTLARLAVGPGLFTVINIAAVFVLVQFANTDVTLFVVNVVLYYLSFVPLHLTATALSLAYREAEAMIDA